jgi:ribonuclease HII
MSKIPMKRKGEAKASGPSLEAELLAHKEGHQCVAGVDEAGRGPMAGPVVAGAVVIQAGCQLPDGVNDSKKLTEAKREKLFAEIMANPSICVGVGIADVSEIDQLNILRATHLAMRRAVENLGMPVDFCLIDGLPVRNFPWEHRAIVKGDSYSLSISAASIVAKVTRDHMMLEADQQYPLYGFAKHKGYGTQEHLQAIRQYGPCPIHRRTFGLVAQMELPLI